MQNRGKGKGYKSEIVENVLGTNSDGKETRTRINGLDHKEEINIQVQQVKKQEFKKNEDRIRRLWVISKCANI